MNHSINKFHFYIKYKIKHNLILIRSRESYFLNIIYFSKIFNSILVPKQFKKKCQNKYGWF